MPQFSYTARNREGGLVTDTLEASSREAAGQILRSQGLLPTAILAPKLLSLGVVFKPHFFRKTLLGHVSLLERLTFINNLAVMLRAGLPVARALNVLTKQMPNPYFCEIVSVIAQNVETGKSLSESMASYPRIFSPMVYNMVKVGEQSGELDKTLEYLGTQISRDYHLIRRTRGALLYPAVVLFALLVIGYLMFTFVLPKLTATFKEFNTELPFLTVTIIKAVDLLERQSLPIAAAAVGLAAALAFWRKTATGRAIIHKLTLSLPILGPIVKKLNLARFTIVFSGLMRSGMPIVEALKVSSDTMTNIYYQQAIADASDKVKIGVDLVAALERYPKLFTPMVTQMIAVGEESGTMEKVLAEVSNFYESAVDDTVKNLSSIIEPVLVIVIGAIVGVLAVGLILPIYNIGQNI